MTLPSSKMKRVTFEDPDVIAQRSHRNATLAQTPLHGAAVIAPDRGLQGQYHNAKRDDANRLAAAIMATNKSKAISARSRPWNYDQKRVGLAPFGRSEGIYNATNNIWLNAPKNEYEDIYGGVLSTKAGQTFKAKKLAQRVVNLNAREAVAGPVSSTVPTNSKVSDVLYTPSKALVDVQSVLNELQGNITSNVYSAGVLESANRYYRVLQTNGPVLEEDVLMTNFRAVDEMLKKVFNIMELLEKNSVEGGLSTDRFRVAENVLIILLSVRGLLEGLVSVSDRPPKERKMSMGAIVAKSQQLGKDVPSGRVAKVNYWRDVLSSGKIISGGRLIGGCDCPDEVPKKKRF